MWNTSWIQRTSYKKVAACFYALLYLENAQDPTPILASYRFLFTKTKSSCLLPALSNALFAIFLLVFLRKAKTSVSLTRHITLNFIAHCFFNHVEKLMFNRRKKLRFYSLKGKLTSSTLNFTATIATTINTIISTIANSITTPNTLVSFFNFVVRKNSSRPNQKKMGTFPLQAGDLQLMCQ